MTVSKDGNTGRWMSQVRVTDWTGKTIHKKKRGFQTKREALQWEQDFIRQITASLDMTFQDFIELYIEDMKQRLEPSTVACKRFLIDRHIVTLSAPSLSVGSNCRSSCVWSHNGSRIRLSVSGSVRSAAWSEYWAVYLLPVWPQAPLRCLLMKDCPASGMMRSLQAVRLARRISASALTSTSFRMSES